MGLQRTDSFGGTTLLPPKLNTLESEGRVALSGPGCGEAGTEDCYQNGKKTNKKVHSVLQACFAAPVVPSMRGARQVRPLQFFPVILIMALIICHCSGAALE